MPCEIVRWLRVKEASAPSSGRYVVWGKTQCSWCLSRVTRLCQREPEVLTPLEVVSYAEVMLCMKVFACSLLWDTYLYEYDWKHWMWPEVLSRTWNLYPGNHAHFQATSEAMAVQVSQNTHQCLQIPDKTSLQLSAESVFNFPTLSYWKR